MKTEISLNALKRFPYSDILGWSVSRYDKFQACKRQYYYDYYAKFDKEFGRERINVLKSMTSIALESGNIVHDVVKTLLERLLKSDTPVNKPKLLDYAEALAVKYCGAKVFAEVYYKDIPELDPSLVIEKVRLSLSNFVESQRFTWITEQALTNKNGWVIEPPGYGETRINSLKAYCKVDFLFPVDDTVYIMDWKTGKPDEIKHKKQMLGYSTWANFHFGTEPAKIVPIVAYLAPLYSEASAVFVEADFTAFASRVGSETAEMQGFCQNPSLNIPKDKASFAQTVNLKICRYCNYRELCGR